MVRECDFDLFEPALGSDAAQVGLEQRSDVSRVNGVSERIEAILHDESQLAQEAKLVRGCDEDNPARTREANKFAHKRARVFEVLDGLDGDYGIRASVLQGNGRIEIGLDKFRRLRKRKSLVPNDIDSDI